MIITLTAKRKIEYTNKDGRAISGVEVHGVMYDNTDDKYEGQPCFIQYIPGVNYDTLVVGENYALNIEVAMFNGKPTARFVGLYPVKI